MVNRPDGVERRILIADPQLVRWDINQLVNATLTASYGRASMPPLEACSAESGRGASVIYYCNRGKCDSAIQLMTHFPQPHPSRRAARVQLGDSVLAAIRLEDGRRTKAKLQTISVTGGLLQLAQFSGTGRLRRSCLSDAGRSGARHGRSSQPHAEDGRTAYCNRSALSRLRMTTIAACVPRSITSWTGICWA